MIKFFIALGILVVLLVLIIVFASLASAHMADQHSDYLYYKMHRGDNDGNN